MIKSAKKCVKCPRSLVKTYIAKGFMKMVKMFLDIQYQKISFSVFSRYERQTKKYANPGIADRQEYSPKSGDNPGIVNDRVADDREISRPEEIVKYTG